MVKCSILVVLGVLVASTARVEAQAADAEKLFKDGKRLMGEKKYAEACDAFEVSHKLDPAVNTLANLADCREKNGQLASAWDAFLELERDTRNDKQQAALHKVAQQRGAAIEPRLSYLTINVPDTSRVDGLVIKRDGIVVEPMTWNRSLPVDGGEHVIEASAPAHEPWSSRVTVAAENDKQTVDVPRFEPKPADPVVDEPPPPVDEPVEEPVETKLVEPAPPPPPRSGRKRLGLIVGAGGLTLAAGGAVFAVIARGHWADARALCGEDLVCDSDEDLESGNAMVEDARGAANVATGLVAAGSIAVVAGGVLWLTAPDDSERAIQVAPTTNGQSAGVVVTGRF